MNAGVVKPSVSPQGFRWAARASRTEFSVGWQTRPPTGRQIRPPTDWRAAAIGLVGPVFLQHLSRGTADFQKPKLCPIGSGLDWRRLLGILICMNVGVRLRGLREAKGLSQADIEKRSGLLRSYVARVENGSTSPSLETLERFSKALDVEPHQLLFKERNSPKKFGRTRITTPFPSIAEIAKLFGISKERVYRVSRLVESVQTGNHKIRRAG